MPTGYYVARRAMKLDDEFGPTEKAGVSLVCGISRIDEVKYSWLGIGNEGKGRWSPGTTGEVTVCEIYCKGVASPVIVLSTLENLNEHLYLSAAEAANEK